RDRAAQPRHAARGEPPAQAGARLCAGPRRWEDHRGRGGRRAQAAGRGRVRPRRHGRAHSEGDHRAVRGRPRRRRNRRRRRGGRPRDPRRSVRAVPHAAGLSRPHAARPVRHGERVPALRFHSSQERRTADDVRHLNASDFEYHLPPDRIAQHPLPDRAASRLLVLERATGAVRHAAFREVVSLIAPQDVLVLNASRVIPARLRGTRDGGRGTGTTGAPAEILLVRELPDGSWLAMGHPGGKLKPGRHVHFGDDAAVEIAEVLGGGLRRVRFVGTLDAARALAKYGEVPLPPYIHRPPHPEDRERYQTVYAEHDGSVAAPTAGLHFTAELLQEIRAKGAAVATLDLHIGPGTFKPVQV